MGRILPACPEHHQRPRAEGVMMAVQLARCFVTPEGFANAFCKPGSILFFAVACWLLSGHDDKTFYGPSSPARIFVRGCTGRMPVRVSELLGSAAAGKETGYFGLAKSFEHVIDEGRPLLLVGANPSTLPASFARVLEAEINLPELDREMLRVILGHLYPGQIVHETDIPASISAAEVAALTPEQLTIAARAPNPIGAGQVLVRLLNKGKISAAPGLADFPLAADVRGTR